jgi:SAM-dependent methyltransferase
MSVHALSIPLWQALNDAQAQRWRRVLDTLMALIPAGTAAVVIDARSGADAYRAAVADRLAAVLHDLGRPCARLTSTTPLADEDTWRAEVTGTTVAIADGDLWRAHPPTGRWSLVIWLRTPPGHHHAPLDQPPDADVVIDLHDPAWPVIRHINARLADHESWYLAESRAFFATRAATWDTKFGDDTAAYAAAIAEAAIPAGATVLDLGCGTGRALPCLRAAVGAAGTVIGVDITEQMIAAAINHDRGRHATLVLADARHLPLAGDSIDAVFAAGLVQHLPDPGAGLTELARITRQGGQLVLFHPSGRAALAARHGHALRPDEPLAETPLRAALIDAGFRPHTYDDPPHRFFARAIRD